MGWLVWHDIVPAWTAQQPPSVVRREWVGRWGKQAQYGIYGANKIRIGGIWTRYSGGSSTDRDDAIYIHDFPMLGPAYIEIRSAFNPEGRLDEVDIAVLGNWKPIRIHGERYHKEFAFRVDAGTFQQVFKIDLALAGTFSDMFHPFDAMPDIKVGQSWRMQVFNPVAAVLGVGDRFTPMLVEVVGREIIHINGGVKDCFVVEAPGVKAWVRRISGQVLIQEVTLPVGGTFVVKLEPYDADALKQASTTFNRYMAQLQESSGHEFP